MPLGGARPEGSEVLLGRSQGLTPSPPRSRHSWARVPAGRLPAKGPARPAGRPSCPGQACRARRDPAAYAGSLAGRRPAPSLPTLPHSTCTTALQAVALRCSGSPRSAAIRFRLPPFGPPGASRYDSRPSVIISLSRRRHSHGCTSNNCTLMRRVTRLPPGGPHDRRSPHHSVHRCPRACWLHAG